MLIQSVYSVFHTLIHSHLHSNRYIVQHKTTQILSLPTRSKPSTRTLLLSMSRLRSSLSGDSRPLRYRVSDPLFYGTQGLCVQSLWPFILWDSRPLRTEQNIALFTQSLLVRFTPSGSRQSAAGRRSRTYDAGPAKKLPPSSFPGPVWLWPCALIQRVVLRPPAVRYVGIRVTAPKW